jgi:hypothetical protein
VTNVGGPEDSGSETESGSESESSGARPKGNGGAGFQAGGASDDFPVEYGWADERPDVFDDEAGAGGDAGGDAGDDVAHVAHTALPPKVESWRRRSATGAVLTGFALGLQQALGKEQEQPAVIMQTSGDPPRDLPVEAEVEQGRPRQSVVNIRPWLLSDRRDQTDPGADTGAGTVTEPGPGGPRGSDGAERTGTGPSAAGPEEA